MKAHSICSFAGKAVVLFSLLSVDLLAATFTVVNTSDSGPGSLRNAIQSANGSSGGKIVFSATGTITLVSGLPAIARSTTLTGPGTNLLTISGNNAVQVFMVKTQTSVTISGLTIANGRATGYANGAGISNAGTLTILNCALLNNQTFGGWGGAVFNSGELAIINSTFSGNQVLGENGSTAGSGSGGGAGLGGGLFTASGRVLITNCTFHGNVAVGGNGGGEFGFGTAGSGRGGGVNGGEAGSEINWNGKSGGFGGGGGVGVNGGNGGFGGGGGGAGQCGEGGQGGFGGGNGGGKDPQSGVCPYGAGGGGAGIGGGIFLDSGTVSIIKCSFSANQAIGGTGGVSGGTGHGGDGSGIGADLYNLGGTIPCVLTCPNNMIVTNAPGLCGAFVSFNPTSNFGCGIVTCNPPSGSFFNLGTNLITCYAIDFSGATNTCHFTITVINGETPTINCSSIPPLTNFVGSDGLAMVPDVTGLVRNASSDNCTSNNLVGVTQNPVAGTTIDTGPGNYPITAIVSSQAGNGATCSVTVTVKAGIAIYVDGQYSSIGSQVIRRGSATIALQTAFADGTILYTLDGSDPRFNSRLYSGPFSVRQSCTVRAVAYNADFSQQVQSFPLAVVIVPILIATTAGGGSVTIQPPDGQYFSNSMATVTATPSSGWVFLQWLGDASGTNPTNTVIMNRDKYVEAVFGTAVGTIVVGSGSVMAEPSVPLHPFGNTIRFTAQPQTGNHFSTWGNAASGNVNPLYFTVTSAAPTVSSLFAALGANQHALTVIPDGFGRVTITPQTNVYVTGASASLNAIPDLGQQFLAWAGDATGTQNPLLVSMNTSMTITATFTRKPTLAVVPPIGGLSEDGFRLTLMGEFGAPYQILSSTNLLDWTQAGMLTNTYGTTQWTDSDATNLAHRLYRASSMGP